MFGTTETRTPNLLLVNLGPAFFSPTYKYFDQLLQTVKNETTVLLLAFKEILQTSIPSLIFILYAKGCHYFLMKNFCLTVPKIFVEEPFFAVQNFWYRKNLWIRGGQKGVSRFFLKFFLSDSAWKFRMGTHQCVINFGYRKILGFRESCHDFVSKILSHSAEKFRRETFLICASENFWSRKRIRIRGGGKYHDFLSKLFAWPCRKTS